MNLFCHEIQADLIHLGAKFAPCMRKDKNIMKEIEKWREKERETACCIRNDDSGCIQASKEQCTVRYIIEILNLNIFTIFTYILCIMIISIL